MKYITFLFFISFTYSQWSSFKLSNLESDNKQNLLLYRYGGIVSTIQPYQEIKGLNRVSLGFSINKGLLNSGMIPIIQGQIKASWNLSFRVRMANYSEKESSTQLYGWGLSLQFGKKNQPSKWKILFDSGTFNSFDQFKLNSIQSIVIRSFNLRNVPMYIGIGTNITGRILQGKNEVKNSSKIKLQSNLINIGGSFHFFRFRAIPQLWFGMDYNLISISFVSSF